VYYLWEAGAALNAVELRFPGVTPCAGRLPPGIYWFQARLGSRQSAKVRVPVAGSEKIAIDIQVP